AQPFTKVLDQTPTTKLTSHTNLCLVNVSAQGSKAVVTAAIDNLVKGASGQGVECFNIGFGFGRTEGLEGTLQWPWHCPTSQSAPAASAPPEAGEPAQPPAA